MKHLNHPVVKATMTTVRVLLLTLLVLIAPRLSSAFVDVGINVNFAPPPLPVYVQPPCPTDGYLWTPGYWDYTYEDGYFWVPGVWIAPPRVGFLWTPGYWAFDNGFYGWHRGYWGPHVGFYGGVNYGFGYPGAGFCGGGWFGGGFRYNTAVVNVNTTIIHNTYVDRTVINNNNNGTRASFNGRGGVQATPNAQQRTAMNEQHIQPTAAQDSHRVAASRDRSQFASANHGRPGVAAMNSVNGRRFNQQGRIANGAASGQLTAGETKNLENREANVNKTVHDDRQANGGTLTPQEKSRVEQRQDNLSKSINADKHNDKTASYGDNKVGERRDEQQQRIAHGIDNGQITPKEASRDEQHEQNINRHVSADRQANGGRLNGAEKRNINQRQNKASQQVHNQRQNDRQDKR